jgi:hypothetical protein
MFLLRQSFLCGCASTRGSMKLKLSLSFLPPLRYLHRDAREWESHLKINVSFANEAYLRWHPHCRGEYEEIASDIQVIYGVTDCLANTIRQQPQYSICFAGKGRSQQQSHDTPTMTRVAACFFMVTSWELACKNLRPRVFDDPRVWKNVAKAGSFLRAQQRPNSNEDGY